MRIGPGDNTVRVFGLRKAVQGIYDVYQFEVVNLYGKTHGFAYAVPAGSTVLPQLVTDLRRLQQLNIWVTVYLKEVKRQLAIQSIKEPKTPQGELWEITNGTTERVQLVS
jgi:hypothetical protein